MVRPMQATADSPVNCIRSTSGVENILSRRQRLRLHTRRRLALLRKQFSIGARIPSIARTDLPPTEIRFSKFSKLFWILRAAMVDKQKPISPQLYTSADSAERTTIIREHPAILPPLTKWGSFRQASNPADCLYSWSGRWDYSLA